MRYLMIYKTVEAQMGPPSPEMIAEMGGDTVTVTDGPFTEAKELVGGFAVVEAQSKEEAIDQARQFLAVAGDGETEVRQTC